MMAAGVPARRIGTDRAIGAKAADYLQSRCPGATLRYYYSVGCPLRGAGQNT